jgi:hypothetical protein
MTTNNNEKPLATSILRPALLAALEAAGPNGLRAVDARRAAVEKAGGTFDRDASNVPMHDTAARGLIENVSRGVYRITDAGRAVLAGGALPASRKADAAPGAPVGDTPVPTMARADDTPAPTVESPAPTVVTVVDDTPAPAKRRLKVANAPAAPAVDVPAWLHDEGIRALAVEATECFGAWAAKSGECGRCPLAGWCRNAKAATLALLASKLNTDTPATPAPVTAPVAKLDAAVGAANAPDAPRAAVDPALAGTRLKATHDGVCAVSGRPIAKGDAVRYVAGVGVVHLDVEVPAK